MSRGVHGWGDYNVPRIRPDIHLATKHPGIVSDMCSARVPVVPVFPLGCPSTNWSQSQTLLCPGNRIDGIQIHTDNVDPSTMDYTCVQTKIRPLDIPAFHIIR